MKQSVPDSMKLSPFFTFYIVASSQIGVGILSYQGNIAKYAGYDSWISIFFIGAVVSIVVMMIYKMFSVVQGGFVKIHEFVFGKTISKIFSILAMVYLLMIAISTIRNYTEIVQVWMFERLSTFWFSLCFLIIVMYAIFGGFRTVVGMMFFSFFMYLIIFPAFFFTLPYADFSNLLPVWDHSVKELILSSKAMSFSMDGFEILLFVYPFIKEPEKSRKWSLFAILFATLLYVIIAIITFTFFPEEQLKKNIWASLTIWKIITLPFIERFEYIGIAIWFMIVMPNVALIIWSVGRLAKVIFSINQKKFTPFLCGIVLIGCLFLGTRYQIDTFKDITAYITFYFCYVYLPILFILVLIRKAVKKRAQKD